MRSSFSESLSKNKRSCPYEDEDVKYIIEIFTDQASSNDMSLGLDQAKMFIRSSMSTFPNYSVQYKNKSQHKFVVPNVFSVVSTLPSKAVVIFPVHKVKYKLSGYQIPSFLVIAQVY